MNELKFNKWVDILLNVKEDINVSKMSRSLDITYSHIVNVLQVLEKNKLLIIEKQGRENKVSLTKKGRSLKQYFFLIKKEIKQ